MIKFLEKTDFDIGNLFLIYLTLAYKNPFKDNNLISNWKPYPDCSILSGLEFC